MCRTLPTYVEVQYCRVVRNLVETRFCLENNLTRLRKIHRRKVASTVTLTDAVSNEVFNSLSIYGW